MKPPARILDLGCGTGSQAQVLAGEGFRVTAADIDFDAVATGRELLATSTSFAESNSRRPDFLPDFVAADAVSLPFPDACFDAVACVDVLHWSPHREAFRALWNEAWRVLGRGGLFAVRSLLRDALPTGMPLNEGRYRLASGAEWFLPAQADFEALLAACAGEWAQAPVALPDGHGAAWLIARKIA